MKRVVIGGSGFFGITCARVLAEFGYCVTVLEKEHHIGGLAYDYEDKRTGICVHKYGPHVLNINNYQIYEFLKRFAQFESCEIIRNVMVGSKLLPLPINYNSIQKLNGTGNWNDVVQKLNLLGREEITLGELLRINDETLHRLGRIIYEKVYLGYNIKMWGKNPEEVNPQTINRMPIRLNDNVGLDGGSMHLLPVKGYMGLFHEMLNHEKITIRCNTDFVSYWNELHNNETNGENVIGIFSGPIDELFSFKYGVLQYRSIIFKKTYHQGFISEDSCVVTYPTKYKKTRTTDMGMLTGTRGNQTVWVSEYPRAYEYGNRKLGKPAYPVNDQSDKMILEKYLEEVKKQKNLYVGGRLAEYKYYDMEDTILSAIKCAEEIKVNDR